MDFLPKHLKDNIMNIIKRTCATCAHFNQAPEGDDPACLNLTSIIEQHGTPQAWHREPGAADYCGNHQTHEEDAAETHEIRAAQHLSEATPEFMEATRACFKLRDKLGESHPDVQEGILFALNLAPQSLKDHLAAQQAAADKHNAEVARQVAESTPEFLAAMSACLRLVETLGMEHPDTTRALQRAMLLSPPSLNDFMAEQAKELGLIPDATGYTDDGRPVFSLESIAAKLDMSMDEAKQAMEAMLDDRAALGLPAVLVDAAMVHRKH